MTPREIHNHVSQYAKAHNICIEHLTHQRQLGGRSFRRAHHDEAASVHTLAALVLLLVDSGVPAQQRCATVSSQGETFYLVRASDLPLLQKPQPS